MEAAALSLPSRAASSPLERVQLRCLGLNRFLLHTRASERCAEELHLQIKDSAAQA